jgi:caffeoyl-CoA O-methyltransferase
MTLIKPRPVTPLGILVENLESIVEQAKKSEIDSELKANINQAYQLAAGIDSYLTEVSTPESQPLANLAQKTSQEDWSKLFSQGETPQPLEQEMLSGHIEGQMLKMFVRMLKAKKVLEVGMFTGYSALAMAEALPENGEVVACELDNYVAQFAQNCFALSPHGDKIKIKVGPALETMQNLANAGESFDLVFIDASKKEYVDYFKLLLDTNLLQPDGIIAVDNTLYQGQVYLPKDKRTANGEAIANFNQVVAEDDRVEQVLLPLRDGLTIIRRSLN